MSKIVTATGADVSLFHLAARAMGDPLQWYRIADANGGLSEPMISGIMHLTVPDPDPTTTGGIPQQ